MCGQHEEQFNQHLEIFVTTKATLGKIRNVRSLKVPIKFCLLRANGKELLWLTALHLSLDADAISIGVPDCYVYETIGRIFVISR